jgi:hypothetical protein
VTFLVLREVLKCICRKRYINVAEISREISIPMGLVEHAIQKLKGMEYLKVITPLNEETPCSFCPLKSSCHIKTAGAVKSYILTEKGRKLLEK